MSDLITTREAAAMLNCTMSVLHGKMIRGRIEYTKRNGRCYFTQAEVDRVKEARAVKNMGGWVGGMHKKKAPMKQWTERSVRQAYRNGHFFSQNATLMVMATEDPRILDEVCRTFGYDVDKYHAGIVEPGPGHRFAACIDPDHPYSAKFKRIGPAIDEEGVVRLPTGIAKCRLGEGTFVHGFHEATNLSGGRGVALCGIHASPLRRTTDEINCQRCLTKLSRM